MLDISFWMLGPALHSWFIALSVGSLLHISKNFAMQFPEKGREEGSSQQRMHDSTRPSRCVI